MIKKSAAASSLATFVHHPRKSTNQLIRPKTVGFYRNKVKNNTGDSLAARADAELADDTRLEPWWVAPGSTTQRIVFAVPGSDKPAHLAKLNRERALYRLVLGMPDQEDLLELIATGEAWDSDTVRRACLDLSAWGGLHG